jgi:regulator of nucleoside diphosphate kinase
MKYENLILEKKEYVYLKRILNISGYSKDFKTQRSLQRLFDELTTAQIVDDSEMPEDVIRFNTKVKVIAENGWEKTLQIVIPSERDLTQDKISILTPIASALIGYAEGDEIIWDFPIGKKQIKIVEVIQDENLKRIELTL